MNVAVSYVANCLKLIADVKQLRHYLSVYTNTFYFFWKNEICIWQADVHRELISIKSLFLYIDIWSGIHFSTMLTVRNSYNSYN